MNITSIQLLEKHNTKIYENYSAVNKTAGGKTGLGCGNIYIYSVSTRVFIVPPEF